MDSSIFDRVITNVQIRLSELKKKKKIKTEWQISAEPVSSESILFAKGVFRSAGLKGLHKDIFN